MWHGWNLEDKLIVDEAEQLDYVVGFLDEKQTPRMYAERTDRSHGLCDWPQNLDFPFIHITTSLCGFL